MKIELAPERLENLRRQVQRLFAEEFDETLSDFKADAILEAVIAAAGPSIYNQAVQDARAFMQTRLDDLDGEVYIDES
ncbi:MAG: DUF2164 domain-containing protein [Pseudomonadota bacterium]